MSLTLPKILTRTTAALLIFSCCLVSTSQAETIDLVRVIKSSYELQLLANNKIIKTYTVALGSNPDGHKQKSGDGRTPEGSYVLDFKKADSAFHKAIHISYPNAKDVQQAQKHGLSPGGDIMVHGQKNGLGWLAFISQKLDWTNGCIALNNSDMDEVLEMVNAGTKIEILP